MYVLNTKVRCKPTLKPLTHLFIVMNSLRRGLLESKTRLLFMKGPHILSPLRVLTEDQPQKYYVQEKFVTD